MLGVTALVLAIWGPSEPPPRQRVAVAELVVEGDATGEASVVADRIRSALERGRYELVALEDDCADVECLREAGKRAGAIFVVRSELRREASDHTVAIEVIDVHDGSVVSEATDGCDLCGRSELLDLTGDLADKTRKRLDRLAGEPAVLSLTSSPRGATVTVDGEVVGTTPVRHAMAPGPHEITVALAGHQTIVRTTEVVGGTEEKMQFALVPTPSAGERQSDVDTAAQRRNRAFVGAGAGLLVAGLGGVAVGAALVAIHATPIEGECSADDVDVDGDCRFLHDTQAGGIAGLAIGGAGVVAGAVLLGIGLKRRGSQVRGSASPRSVSVEVRF